MGDAGWVRLGELNPGDLFETSDGRRYHRGPDERDWQGRPYQDVRAVGQGDDYHGATLARFPTDTEVRPLTPVPVAPDLDPTTRGLLLTALERGTADALAALADRLAEVFAPPDVVAAVRERCADFAESAAKQFDQPGGLEYFNAACARTAREIAFGIRGLGSS